MIKPSTHSYTAGRVRPVPCLFHEAYYLSSDLCSNCRVVIEKGWPDGYFSTVAAATDLSRQKDVACG